MKHLTRILTALALLALFAACDSSPEPSFSAPDPIYPFAVTTLDGENITPRVEELWNFANALYAPPAADSGDRLCSTHTGYVAYVSIDERFDTRRDYFTSAGMDQLDAARDADGSPVFYTRNATTYRRPAALTDLLPGEITGITTLSTAADRIVMSIEYADPALLRSDAAPDESSRRFVNFTVAFSEGAWKIADYAFPDPAGSISYSASAYMPGATDLVTYDTRSAILDAGFIRDDYYDALRRVHLLQNLDTLGIDRAAIDLDSLAYTHLYLWYLADENGTEYLIQNLGDVESRERYPDLEQPPLCSVFASTDENGDWLPADASLAVDAETSADVVDLILRCPPRFSGRDANPATNITVFRRYTGFDGYYIAFGETTTAFDHDGVIDLIYDVELFSDGHSVSDPLARFSGEGWARADSHLLHVPSRSDLLSPCSDSTLLREMRRVYFMENCHHYFLYPDMIVPDSIEWEDDATFTISTADGDRYSITFLSVARVAEQPASREIFEITLLNPTIPS